MDQPVNMKRLLAAPALLLMVEESHVDFLRARHVGRVVHGGEDRRTAESVARLPNAQQTGGYGYSVDAGGVARVKVRGVITPEQYAWYDDEETISDWVVRDLAAIELDQAVRAVLFEVDSPGGYVAGTFELADAIQQLSAKKPTATVAGGHCCSAAYLLASVTGHITAFRTSIVGSIGTRSALIDAREYFARFGVKVIPIDSGGMKSAGLIGTEITPEQIQYFRGHVMKLQESFTKAVADGRRMTLEWAQSLADGRVHVGSDALALGLIDALGTARHAYQALVGRADPGKLATPTPRSDATANESTAQAAGEDVPAAGAEAESQTGEASPEEDPDMSQSHAAAPANPTAGATAASAASSSTEPKPATIAELKAAFPSDPAFALESAEKALTLVEAKAAYADVLQQRLTAEQARTAAAQSDLARQQAQAAQQAAQQAGTKRVGVKPVESAAAEAGGADGGAAAEFEQRVADTMKAYSLPRHEAAQRVLAGDQALRERYVAEQNAAREQRVAGRR